MITERQILKFYGDDSVEEIAQYTASNLRLLGKGLISVEQFISLHIPEEEPNEDE